MPDHSAPTPAFTVAGKDYRVLRYELDEQLSHVGKLSCTLSLGDEALPQPGEILDQRATFTIGAADDDAVKRSFEGFVIRAELAPLDDDVPALHVVVAPTIWNLEKRASCRIFQDMSAIDIVKKVFEEAGVPPKQQAWHLDEPHEKRVYTAQYRETDLDFVLRLLFEEGIYFAVQVQDGSDVTVFADAKNGFGDIEGATTLSYFERFGFDGGADRIFSVTQTVSVKTDKGFSRDYNPDKPSLKLEGGAEGTDPGAHALEVYEYPSRGVDEAAAKRIAQLIVDASQSERDVVHGETASVALVPGLRFSIGGHPYEPLNREYLVTRSRISGARHRQFTGTQADAVCRIEFWGVPTETTRYRPARRQRERFVSGLQTALTTGPSGEEIHTDAGGHVKASFPWDRSGIKDDKSSRWMRTSQLPTGGSMLLPRVGWEVTVNHLEGDVDRPLVMGRVYNALTPPPYSLPKDAARSSIQTATTPGGGTSNEVRMTDSSGAEEIFFNGSRDMTTHVKNNATETIANDLKKKVGSNQKVSITDSASANVGSNQKLTVKGKQTVHVETYSVDEVTGSHAFDVAGNRDLKIGGDHKRDVGADSKLKVDGNHIDLCIGSVTNATMASFTHDVGDAMVNISLKDRTVTVAGSITESSGAAKVIAVKGGRGVEVGGSMNQKVVGAIVNSANGDRTEQAGSTYTEVAAGAHIIKADNVTFEAETMLTLVMGASTLTLLPAVVAIAGVSIKLDGDTSDTGIVVDN